MANFFVVIGILLFFFIINLNAKNEQNLFDDLLDDYNVMARPLVAVDELWENGTMALAPQGGIGPTATDPVKVHLKFSLIRLIELDSRNQVARFYAWLEYLWNDPKLRWEPEEYENITDISMPIGKIWRPELFLYNAVDSQFDLGYPTNIFLNYTGDARWVTPSIFKSTCIMEITWFPFDEQYCFLEFAPWTYSADQMQLQSNAENDFSIKSYVVNGEWELNEHYVVPYHSYDCCPKVPFSGLTFFMHFRRRTLYYLVNMIFPSLIITLISLLSFVLPPESGDKTAIQIAVLLSICFFFSILSGMLPATSEAVPLLGLFFVSCMLIVTASLCSTVYVLNLHYRTRKMGPMANALLLHWLPWALRMTQNNDQDKNGQKDKPTKFKWADLPPLLFLNNGRNRHQKDHSKKDDSQFDASENLCTDDQSGKAKESDATLKNEQGGQQSLQQKAQCSSHNLFPASANLQAIQQQIQSIQKQLEKDANLSKEENAWTEEEKWKFAGQVVDRLCFLLFSVLILASIAAFLLRAPYIIA